MGFDALSKKPFSDIRSFVRFAPRGAPDTGGYTGSLFNGGAASGGGGPSSSDLGLTRCLPVLVHRGPELQTLQKQSLQLSAANKLNAATDSFVCVLWPAGAKTSPDLISKPWDT